MEGQLARRARENSQALFSPVMPSVTATNTDERLVNNCADSDALHDRPDCLHCLWHRQRRVPRLRGLRHIGALLALDLLVSPGALAKEAVAHMQISSSSFGHMGAIPAQYTCEGVDTSPPLAWSGVPPSAKSLVLIVDDPDAPDPKAPKMTWVHWIVYNLPPSSASLMESASGKSLPEGAKEGLNDWKKPAYGGPCPPIGRHRYFFKLYAVDTMLTDLVRPSKADVEKAIQGHVVSSAELVGTYQKSKH
jgi:Raf kinase inhibitor-like YbhB/YbcL family protein